MSQGILNTLRRFFLHVFGMWLLRCGFFRCLGGHSLLHRNLCLYSCQQGCTCAEAPSTPHRAIGPRARKEQLLTCFPHGLLSSAKLFSRPRSGLTQSLFRISDTHCYLTSRPRMVEGQFSVIESSVLSLEILQALNLSVIHQRLKIEKS